MSVISLSSLSSAQPNQEEEIDDPSLELLYLPSGYWETAVEKAIESFSYRSPTMLTTMMTPPPPPSLPPPLPLLTFTLVARCTKQIDYNEAGLRSLREKDHKLKQNFSCFLQAQRRTKLWRHHCIWMVLNVESMNGQQNVVLNYLVFAIQSLKVNVGPASTIAISLKLNDGNIIKNFPNMDACSALRIFYLQIRTHKLSRKWPL
ncbi:Hypothetical predicted protein [Olea europaea subsp. europaea]|uniref:Uncharacterized protein n=1 Tax=Olea europaea subsp. europaea TaxID=158383 RepID=A0A8S0U619_OLEEU|nr:Hypothetical predicted protein [Olea europaea subsp. europaea]